MAKKAEIVPSVKAKSRKRKKVNWWIVTSNLTEAKEQIESTLRRIKARKNLNEEYLQVELEHATHHLYFGWNARHQSTKAYSKLGHKQFNAWSKVPKEFWIMEVKSKKKI